MKNSKDEALAWLSAYRICRFGKRKDPQFYQPTRITSAGMWITGKAGELWEKSKAQAFVFDCDVDASNFIAACLGELPRAILHIVSDPPIDPLSQAIRKARRRGRKNAALGCEIVSMG